MGDQTFGRVTGIQLVTGKTASEKGLFGIETKRRVNIELFAVLSFLAVLGAAANAGDDRFCRNCGSPLK